MVGLIRRRFACACLSPTARRCTVHYPVLLQSIHVMEEQLCYAIWYGQRQSHLPGYRIRVTHYITWCRESRIYHGTNWPGTPFIGSHMRNAQHHTVEI